MENSKLILKKKYKRFFAFGCSYTNYIYPTWADIIAHELCDTTYYNQGRSGAGNIFLLTRLTQANKIFKFNKDDLIMVMYPSYTRDDIFDTDHWELAGSVFNSQNTSRKYDIDKDFLYFIIRDFAIIDSIRTYLKSLTSTTFEILSVPSHGMEANLGLSKTQVDMIHCLRKSYKDIFSDFSTPYGSFLDDLNNRGVIYDNQYDSHPNPYSAFEYLKHIGFEFSNHTHEYVIEQYDFLNKENLSRKEILEICTKKLEIKRNENCPYNNHFI